MEIMETNCIIHWIKIYPVDSAIDLLNNLGLIMKSVILLTIGILEFGIQETGIEYLESGIHSVESRIWGCLRLPYMWRNLWILVGGGSNFCILQWSLKRRVCYNKTRYNCLKKFFIEEYHNRMSSKGNSSIPSNDAQIHSSGANNWLSKCVTERKKWYIMNHLDNNYWILVALTQW